MEVSTKKAPSPPHIPIEIIRCILLKLKMKAVIQCGCVCKEWCSTIEDPNFKLSYRGRRRVLVAAASVSTLAFTSITNALRIKTLFRVVGEGAWWSGVWCSCNGLVLFSVRQNILLWNPTTRCCTKVLELQRLKNGWHPHNLVSGLCYVPSTGDYKVVLLLDNRTVLVASLKNKEWRKVLFPYYPLSGDVNFCNTLHWRVVAHPVRDWRDWCPPPRRLCNKVVYFEAESDEFKELELPTPTFPEESCAILGLGIIDGCLSMVRERGKQTGEVEVLVMKEYGVKKSWVSRFVIFVSASQSRCDYRDCDYHHDFTLYSSKYNIEALVKCSCMYGGWGTSVYHLKNNKVEDSLEVSGRHTNAAAVCSYAESFVSPLEFIWRDDAQRKSRREYDAVLRLILKRISMGRNF